MDFHQLPRRRRRQQYITDFDYKNDVVSKNNQNRKMIDIVGQLSWEKHTKDTLQFWFV